MFEFLALLAFLAIIVLAVFLIVVLAIYHNDKALAHKSIDTLGKMVISSKKPETDQKDKPET